MSVGGGLGAFPALTEAFIDEVVRQLEVEAAARHDALGLTLDACARRLHVALLLSRRLRNAALSSP